MAEFSKRERTKYVKNDQQKDPFESKIVLEGVTGSVKFYNEEKGYGFLRTGNTQDIFFHVTKIPLDVEINQEGLSFIFDVATTRKGMQAVNMKLVV
jgi:CspA family cold shock protein